MEVVLDLLAITIKINGVSIFLRCMKFATRKKVFLFVFCTWLKGYGGWQIIGPPGHPRQRVSAKFLVGRLIDYLKAFKILEHVGTVVKELLECAEIKFNLAIVTRMNVNLTGHGTLMNKLKSIVHAHTIALDRDQTCLVRAAQQINKVQSTEGLAGGMERGGVGGRKHGSHL